MFELINKNTAALTFLVSALAALLASVQFFYGKQLENRQKQFEQYHQLIAWLVERDPETGTTKMGTDQQWAVVFEMRHFPRYFSLTSRVLAYLHYEWSHNTNAVLWIRLLDEMQRTIDFMDEKQQKGRLKRRIKSFLRSTYP